jgi:hypothetical protein
MRNVWAARALKSDAARLQFNLKALTPFASAPPPFFFHPVPVEK